MTLDSTGLTIKRGDEIRSELREEIAASPAFGTEAKTGSDTILGQVVDVVASNATDLWELLQALYDAFDPDSAEGVQLDNIGAIRGIRRDPATYSTTDLELTGVATTVIPAGSRVRVPSGGIFAIDDDTTIGGGGTADATATATISGPVEGLTGTITEIVDAVSGWTGVSNPADAVEGENLEADTDYRERQENSLSARGSATDPALRSRLEALDDVSAAVAISNRSWETDARGIPGKAVRCVVYPDTADPLQIVRTIWGDCGAPAGIYLDGDQEYLVTDNQGYQQTVRFSWATELELYVSATVVPNSDYPTDGDDLAEAAILEYVQTLSVGSDVRPIYIAAHVIANVPGIDDIEVLVAIGGAPGLGDDDPIAVDLDEIAIGDSGRISVSS